MKIYCPKCGCQLEEFIDEMQVFYEYPICDYQVYSDEIDPPDEAT